ncbi:MAG: P1 family peptidase [Chloroflexi bacterium]|nr:P1 family peptidase [Chloroflexota bacterium]
MAYDAITDVPGLRVGHHTDRAAATGCTVVLCESGAVGGVVVRGAAPGTRETDLLRPGNLVEHAHAVLLSGGSAFGLDAASGVMRYLEARGVGFQTRVARVPIVPAAILFDLGIGDPAVRPDAQAGYLACLAAEGGPVAQGSVGAGTGATVGKCLGMERATKGGIGTASATLADGTVVAALVAVNAVGEVVDPESGRILAGARAADGKGFVRTLEVLRSRVQPVEEPATNTTIGVVATNASLTKEQANRLAEMADYGLALAIRPSHTMGDGDVLFALATGSTASTPPLTALGAVAAEVVARAILRAVLHAESLAGVPSARELAGAA